MGNQQTVLTKRSIDTPSGRIALMSMATPVTPQTLYADRLESAIGTLLLIHDREGHMRALDFHDFESRMRRLLRFHYGAEGNDFAIAGTHGNSAGDQRLLLGRSLRDQFYPRHNRRHLFSARGLGGTQNDPSRYNAELWGAGATVGPPEIRPCSQLGQCGKPGCHCGSVPPSHRH